MRGLSRPARPSPRGRVAGAPLTWRIDSRLVLSASAEAQMSATTVSQSSVRYVLVGRGRPKMLHREDCPHPRQPAEWREATAKELKTLPQAKTAWKTTEPHALADELSRRVRRPLCLFIAGDNLLVSGRVTLKRSRSARRAPHPGSTLTRMGTLRSYDSSPWEAGRQAARRTSARKSTLRGRPCGGSRRGSRPADRPRRFAPVPVSRGRAAAQALRRLGAAVALAADHEHERRDESTGPRTRGASQPSTSEHAMPLESGRST
jgi:hypothetical protein